MASGLPRSPQCGDGTRNCDFTEGKILRGLGASNQETEYGYVCDVCYCIAGLASCTARRSGISELRHGGFSHELTYLGEILIHHLPDFSISYSAVYRSVGLLALLEPAWVGKRGPDELVSTSNSHKID